jgi:DNA-binding transcriptional LysR family regulator
MKDILDGRWLTLVKVAQLGSISRAAATLNCAQSAVSRQISQLEQQHGTRLLYRTGRGEPMGEVRVHLCEGASAQLEAWLGQGRLDLSLLLRDEDHTQPGEICLVERPLQLLGPGSDPLTKRPAAPFAELEGLPLVLPGTPHVLRQCHLQIGIFLAGQQLCSSRHCLRSCDTIALLTEDQAKLARARLDAQSIAL